MPGVKGDTGLPGQDGQQVSECKLKIKSDFNFKIKFYLGSTWTTRCERRSRNSGGELHV